MKVVIQEGHKKDISFCVGEDLKVYIQHAGNQYTITQGINGIVVNKIGETSDQIQILPVVSNEILLR